MIDDVFHRQPSMSVRGFVVWVPMARGKQTDVAGARDGRDDPRLMHFWDGDRAMMNATRGVLDIDEECWDVYLLYDRDARWDGEAPPKPAFWMHQLESQPSGPTLDAKIFLEHAQALAK